MVWQEARIVHRRVNTNLRTQAVMLLTACGTAFSGGKKAHGHFKKFLEQFDVEDY